MSNELIPYDDGIEAENEEQYNNTSEQQAYAVLDVILTAIPFYDESQWYMLCFDYGLDDESSPPTANKQRAFQVIFVDILLDFAGSNNCYFAKNGNDIFIYNGQYWIKIDSNMMKYFLTQACINMGIPRWLGSDTSFVDKIHKQLELKGFFQKMAQHNTTHLNLKNGTLRISENGVKLMPYNPKYFLTHQLDFDYELGKTNDLWLNFLTQILPDSDTRKTLQQALGYLFISDLKLEKAIFLYGTGSNGKSVIFEVLKGLLSSDMMTNFSLAALTDTHGYQRAFINNKLINYGTDVSMKRVDPAIFKQLVSGEPIGVRQIKQKPFTMTHYAKMIFNVNKLDDADVESTHGFFRRIIFIPFEVTITNANQDVRLHKKILENKSGVINWIVEGINEVIKNQEIFMSAKCANFLDNFKKESNPILLFIEDYKIIKTVGQNGEVLSFQRLYDTYRVFCKKQGEKAITQRQLGAELKRLGFESTRRKQGNVWFAKFDFIKITPR